MNERACRFGRGYTAATSLPRESRGASKQLIIISFADVINSALYITFAFQCKDACVVCTYCGGFQRLLCPVCHGSKRSVHRNEFTVEFVALKCAKCDVFGMIRCPHCWRSNRVRARTSAQITPLNLWPPTNLRLYLRCYERGYTLRYTLSNKKDVHTRNAYRH